MYKFHGDVKAGQVSVSIPVLLRKTTDNTEFTGAAYGVVTAYYWRQGGTPTAISVSALAAVDSAYSSGGWFEASAAGCPGVYRLDIPNAAFATSAVEHTGDFVIVSVAVPNAYTFTQKFNLEPYGANDAYAELVNAAYGLANLVRSTTPANALTVNALGSAHGDLRTWLGSTPSALATGLVQATVAAMAAAGTDAVEASMNTALDTAILELTQASPPVTPTFREAVMFLYMALRNQMTASNTAQKIHNYTGTCIATSTLSETTGVTTRGAFTAGP
jgi:hypothetical protein